MPKLLEVLVQDSRVLDMAQDSRDLAMDQAWELMALVMVAQETMA